MEFDKSKILTVVTADQAKVGQKGWVGNHPTFIESDVRLGQPAVVLSKVDVSSPKPFAREGGYAWALFYPAPEPTYAERQAEWVKQNNVKKGTRLRVTRGFKGNEDGSDCGFDTDYLRDKAKIVGQVGKVDGFADGNSIDLKFDTGMIWYVPYTVLEVVKEPTYRPYNNDEEFKPYRDEWFRVKYDGGMLRICAYNDKGVQEANGKFNTYQIFFEKAERENGEPCGVKVE